MTNDKAKPGELETQAMCEFGRAIGEACRLSAVSVSDLAQELSRIPPMSPEEQHLIAARLERPRWRPRLNILTASDWCMIAAVISAHIAGFLILYLVFSLAGA